MCGGWEFWKPDIGQAVGGELDLMAIIAAQLVKKFSAFHAIRM
jgi:hypothetical protein